ncbi:hypothetical protein EVAR_31929_1 [Eumeta japonica]|uniref:Uncharacterized protein n=1 Tax=Eumeta variegata TaxID=151549 RepID=A0A4C1WQW6_EUMVA|nr:hypothetical protein EVAR_31929_1 [Eumeta japonica]
MSACHAVTHDSERITFAERGPPPHGHAEETMTHSGNFVLRRHYSAGGTFAPARASHEEKVISAGGLRSRCYLSQVTILIHTQYTGDRCPVTDDNRQISYDSPQTAGVRNEFASSRSSGPDGAKDAPATPLLSPRRTGAEFI